MGQVRRALLSVSNKEGLADFARGLHELEFELLASEGTATFLRSHHIPVKNLEDLTGHGSLLEGRVKTLHPKVHAGILAVPTNPKHLRDLEALGGMRFAMVVVNLYPFEQTVAQVAPDAQIIENIDIGGVALLRSAAKNAEHVAVISDPRQYPAVLDELRRDGDLGPQTRQRLALEAFARTADYDATITNWWSARAGHAMPPYLRISLDKTQDLRYGENPYQKAAFYRDPDARDPSLATAQKLHGKELSFNNLLDFDAALDLALDFPDSVAVIIKHGNPSGAAARERPADAYAAAYAADSKAAYGCVAAFNRTVDLDAVKAMKGHFIEGIIAPDFAADALDRLRKRENIRLLKTQGPWASRPAWRLLHIRGGFLLQTTDAPDIRPQELKVVTKTKPSEDQIRDLLFATTVCKHAKSNAVVLARDRATVAIGAGQVSRVDAVMLAAMKAQGRAGGSVLSSDAFFPFRDGIDEAAKAGVAAILQPGEVVDAANEHGIAMVFSGVRFFKH
ncbi:MAG: bifunctional phosphoribosylaminoimidazolecarboxamide formyltransferase/IMP cyclohydrolase [Methanobacteriota archaeon]|nr:MAG: bifunctional phosphoribosylaminoimidazolecarboxamide formyltransferase/IMP cyclohydrolase [Euryarchaeota archaeon]